MTIDSSHITVSLLYLISTQYRTLFCEYSKYGQRIFPYERHITGSGNAFEFFHIPTCRNTQEEEQNIVV